MAFCMTFSSYFLHKIHIAKIKTNLALFLDHYNLKGWPRLGVDGGKESWFRADVLFLCNRRFKHQRKISESLRPQTAPLRVCCFVLFFLTIIFLPTATSSPLQASGEKAIVNSSQWEILQGKFIRAGCESTFFPGYRGRPAERSYLLHSPASVLLHSFKSTFPWGPKERYSQPLEGDCGVFVIVFQPLSWVLAHNLGA